jgi:hypothetical protein
MNIVKALKNLRPTAAWSLTGSEYEGIVWLEGNEEPIPSKAEIVAEVARLDQLDIDNAYQAKRYKEYPPFWDYLDGVVKGDQEQIQAYIDACLAVKAKYPKP